MRSLTLFLLPIILFTSGCVEDYDVSEVAPASHLDEEQHAGHEDSDTCEECEDGHSREGADVLQAGSESPSGHSHGAGVRNHGTQWFFNQPWAAPFIWGKLARDGLIFLVLAGIIITVTGWRRRK